MNIIEIFIMAIALSMDAFAVAMCKGLSIKKLNLKAPLIVGLYFGGFQALMPYIGYSLANAFEVYIVSFDHWIAFLLLVMIGFNMIKESRECDCENETDASLGFKSMVVLAVATSIDALAGGVTIFSENWSVYPAITMIGVTTFILSILGVKIGNVFGSKYKSKAELTGGVILILMGIKIVIEHLFF